MCLYWKARKSRSSGSSTSRAGKDGLLREQVFTAFIGDAPREDFIPYTADFFLQLEDVKWTIIAGIVGKTLVVSVRSAAANTSAGNHHVTYADRYR